MFIRNIFLTFFICLVTITAYGANTTFTDGEGIDSSDAGGTFTVSGEDATSSNKGIASFSTDNFGVSAGAVTIKDDGVVLGELNDGSDTAAVNDFVQVDTGGLNIRYRTVAEAIDAGTLLTWSGTQINVDTINLGTNTDGNYVAKIIQGNGISSTGASTGENIDHTLSVNLIDSDGASATTGSYSGMEFISSELTIIQGCLDGAPLEWNNTTGRWICGVDGGGAEVNNLETITTGIASTEIPIGTAADTAVYAALSGDATMANNGVVTVVDDLHAHTSTSISGVDISADTNLAVSGTLLALTDDTLSVRAGTLTDEKVCTYEATGTQLDCNEAETGTVNIVRSAGPTLTGVVTSSGTLNVTGTLALPTSQGFSGVVLAANSVGTVVGTIISSGTNITLDLGDDGGNDSTALNEIATTGDTNSIFTESAADKLLIAVGNDWPKSDTADDLTCTNCIGPTEITDLTLGTDTAGDFVSTITAGDGMDSTGATTGEGIAHTLSLDLASVDPATATTGSFSGLEFASGELTIIGGCGDGAPLEWDNNSGRWECGVDGGGGGPWTDADPVLLTTTTRDVAVGAAQISSAKFSIDGDADQVQLAVQGHSTQTGTLILIESSGNVRYFQLTSTGSLIVGLGTSNNTFSVKNSAGTEMFAVEPDGSQVTAGDGSQSTIGEGLIGNNDDGTDADDDFQWKGTGSSDLYFDASTGRLGIGTSTPTAALQVTGSMTLSGSMQITNSTDIGWTVVDQTDNQACNTGCSNGCVFGIENATGTAVTNLVSCTNTTADLCLCAGGS